MGASRCVSLRHGGPLLALVVALLCAHAGPFEPKRSREPLPALSIERGLVLPRGWFELGLTHTTGGEQHRQDLVLRYGIAPRVEVFGGMPVHEAEGRVAVGDTHFGARWELLATDLPTTSVAVELGWSGASGPDEPYGPDGRRFTRGGPGVWTGLGSSRQIGGMVLGAEARATLWVPDDADGLSLQWLARPYLSLQGGPLVLRGGVSVLAEVGTDVRLDLGAEIHASRGVEVGFVGDVLLAGDGLARSPSQGGRASRFGAVARVHF